MTQLQNVGTTALLAFQRALQTTSHNVANVGTEGYTRQRVDLNTRAGQPSASGFVGSGVQVTGVTRLTDQFLIRQSFEQNAEFGRLNSFLGLSQRVDSMISDPASGLASRLSEFFDSLSALEANPSGTAERQGVLASAQQMVDRFRNLDAQLDGLLNESNARIQGGLREVNEIGAEIVRLNQEIPQATGRAGGQPPNDLLDQRDRLVAQLSNQLAVQVQEVGDGTVNVYTRSGLALVVGQTQMQLQARVDPQDSSQLQILLSGNGNDVPLNSSISGGEIGGLIDFQREVLDPAQAELGRIALSLTSSFNAQQAAGTDQLGNAGAALFTPLTVPAKPASSNAGNATISATLTDLGQLGGADYRISRDAGGYSAIDANTGASITMTGSGTATDPLQLPGLSLVISGSANVGDSFLVQPTADAAGQFGVALQHSTGLAAALPVSVAANLGNSGDGRVSLDRIVDANNPALRSGASIRFIDADNYSVDGGAPQAYSSGQPLQVNGAELTISGFPQAGDEFTLQPTGVNSSDGGNASLMSSLRGQGLLDNGTRSLTAANAALVADTGIQTRNAELQSEAVGLVREQVREQLASVSGVNLDEEAANLLRYQQAYEAAAQILRVSDELFASLLRVVSG